MGTIPNYTKGIVRERATAQQTDLSRIESAGQDFRAASKVFDVVAETTSRIKLADDKSKASKALVDAQRQDVEQEAELRQQWTDDPVGFAKAREDFRKERDSNITKGLSTEAAQMYQNNIQSYNLRSFEQDTSWENKTTIENTVNRSDEVVDNLSVMAYEGTPLDELAQHKANLMDTLQETLSSEQLSNYGKSVDKRVFGGVIKGLIDNEPYEAKAVLDEGTYNEFFSVDELSRFNRTVDSKIDKIEKEAKKAREKAATLFISDPAQLAVRNGMETADDMLSWQRANGVMEGNLSLLPKEQAKGIVNQLNGVTDSDQMIGELQKLDQLYPDDEHYAIAMKDLSKNGLSKQMQFLSLMGAEDKTVMDATFNMARDGDNYKQIAKARGITSTDISVAVEDKIQDVRDVLLSEKKDASDLNNKLNSIATYFASQGLDADDAAEQATDWLINKTPLVKVNGNNVRLPIARDGVPQYTPDKIESGLEAILRNLTPDDIAMTTGTGEFDLAAERDAAQFILDKNEKGYYILNSALTPVLNKKGEIISYPLEVVLEAAEGDKSAKEQKIFKENLKKLQSGDF